MLELIAFHFLLCFSYSVRTDISPDTSWLDDVATTCQKMMSCFHCIIWRYNVFDHFLSVYNCKLFCFHKYDPKLLQICVNLLGNTFTAWKLSVFGVIPVRIFAHSDWTRRYTDHLFVFRPNAEIYGPE